MTDYLEKFEKMRVTGNLVDRIFDILVKNIKAMLKHGYMGHGIQSFVEKKIKKINSL